MYNIIIIGLIFIIFGILYKSKLETNIPISYQDNEPYNNDDKNIVIPISGSPPDMNYGNHL